VVTLLVSAILFSGGVRSVEVDPLLVLRGAAASFLFLFVIRLSDDLCDVEVDRATHPERLLCSNPEALRQLRGVRWGLAALALLLLVPRWEALGLVAASLLLFAGFFLVKHRLPPLAQAALLNASLFPFPALASLLLRGEAGPAELLLGAFFWLGGFAHDCSHCLLDLEDVPPEALPPINRIDQRLLAWISLAAFLLAAALGFALVGAGWAGAGFGACLALTTGVVLALEWRLIRRPGAATAKPFYVFGFAFFLLPALAEVVTVLATRA
jgi:hypothetical protein